MIKKKTQFKAALEHSLRALTYLGATIVISAIVIGGTINKSAAETVTTLDLAADQAITVSPDQLSELYIVADLSDVLGLPSASDVASSYVMASTMYSSGQTAATPKMEKPSITDVSTSRGVIEYTVKNGETMDDIAAKYHLTNDQIRWSNNLRTSDISPGLTLYLPSSSGIVYQVGANDTLEAIATRYGSSVDEIVALNDLELSGISEGMRIILKNGSLPETERPEYTIPHSPANYSYLGNSSERQNMVTIGWRYDLGGPYAAGQCTQWAWYMRKDIPGNWGNANTWANYARNAGYLVDNVPSAGAVFQTNAGYYGHVGYVESVNNDGSAVVTEMNYGIPYRVVRSTIPASAVGRFNYIH